MTLTVSGTITARSIETYVLASGANIFSLANVDQNVTGNSSIDKIIGSTGNDTINGVGTNDVISGGPGGDLIIGGSGEDALAGGSGTDTFVFATCDTVPTEPTTDTVQDFTALDDTLEFEVTNSDANVCAEAYGGVDDLRMFGDKFTSNIETAFGTGKNVYFAAAIGGTENSYFAVNIDSHGQIDGGTDTFIEISGHFPVGFRSPFVITFVL